MSQRLWAIMESQFKALVADTFEALCREWVLTQTQAGELPFEPGIVGSTWAADAQIDVVAINWKAKEILLGEAKWGEGRVGRDVIRELADKAPKVMPYQGKGWRIHYAFFAREGSPMQLKLKPRL